MAKLEKYPGVTSYVDGTGETRYRFRRDGKQKAIKGQPGEPEFNEAYLSLIEGRKPRSADVIKIPTLSNPETLGLAWRLAVKSPDWHMLNPSTKSKAIAIAERFLSDRVVPNDPSIWRDMPIRDLKRKHVKHILTERIDRPHAAKQVLVMIRKMIHAAIDEEWIDADPTYRMRWRPKYKGFRSWTRGEITTYCDYWGPGTTPRTVMSIALWLGLRRSDIPAVRWDRLNFPAMWADVDIIKGNKKNVILKMSPMLIEDLKAIPRRGDFVVMTEYGDTYSHKSLTNSMQEWTRKAGLPAGCTIHGLRKTLGKLAAEGGATTRMSMDLLTHTDIAHAELYSRDADQQRLAADALDCAVLAFDKKVAN